MAERVLTLRELNRATLARQLLLERKRLGVLRAIERLAGLQAQWPPSPYIGLWSRLDGFERATLERAVLRGKVLKPTLMRGTLHLVTRRDYPLYYAALRDMPTWFQAHHLEHALGLLDEIRALAPLTHAAALDHIRAKNHEEVDARRIVHAVRRHAHLLHNPESALWTTSPRVVFQAVDEPAEVDAAAARAELVRRYLRAFGPATKADVCDWSGLRVRDFESALDGLPTARNEEGRVLYDVPRAPLPAADTPAPVRFLPKWDNTLLAHADRRRVISDELRRGVVGKNGDVAATVLVGGQVAATWSYDRSGKVTVRYEAPATRTQKAEVADEAARLEAWLR
ncbi:MAG TPA: winged helix DNA-binding domain-containing protein [Gaiellaceae bacterium]|nr:winged helix DNA-binding domain-containing protein [Gaiellaceae bacterium]